MKCLYCDKEIEKETLLSLLVEEDPLCPKCRKAMKYQRKKLFIDDVEVMTFYEYDSLFRDLLLQYKECGDEALKDVFLYGLADYLRLKYHGYSIIYAPSTKAKFAQRGFNHIEEIFGSLGLNELKGLVLKRQLVQEGRNKKERERMIDNYEYIGELPDKVLIVDDVITTGSTIKGIIRAIGKGKTIKAVALARVKK